MRLPSCETSISPTLVVWSLLIGIGSTSGCASAVADVRWQMTARSWSARCNEKKYCPPRTRGTLIRSERMRPERRDLIAARDGRCPSSDWVYLFCASIQARVSGLCWSSSQRYGSTISTPWRVSRTLSVRVGGAATFFAAPLALATGAAPATASAKPSNHEIVRLDLIEDLLVMNAAVCCDERLTPESGIPEAQIRGGARRARSRLCRDRRRWCGPYSGSGRWSRVTVRHRVVLPALCPSSCRSGETGRRAGLKIPFGSPRVRVRLPPPA